MEIATTRLDVVTVPRHASNETFAHSVAAGLSDRPRHLSTRFLYDDVGSALFDAITYLPEYYLTRAETEILRESGWEIVRALNGPIEFLELGSGSAQKTRILIDEAIRAQGSLRYSPIDISAESLRATARRLVDEYPTLRVRAYAADYFDVLQSRLRFERRAMAMFMGSNIGNYAPNEAAELVARIGSVLRPGDGILLGADLIKEPHLLELAYDDPTGVTAAFNRNLLARINRELGGHFEVADFAHVARYDGKRACVDSYLEARHAQSVRIDALDASFTFAQGERVHTESAYKYDAGRVAKLAAHAGMHVARTWTDKRKQFGVFLLEF